MKFRNSTSSFSRVLLASAAISALSGGAALAADDVIIVTATKRATTLQETPVAVSVIGADDIKDSQIRDVRDLQQMGAVTSGRYGFVHGMFALSGSDPKFCNAPNEIDVLLNTCC